MASDKDIGRHATMAWSMLESAPLRQFAIRKWPVLTRFQVPASPGMLDNREAGAGESNLQTNTYFCFKPALPPQR